MNNFKCSLWSKISFGFILLLFLSFTHLNGQNIVNNGSFENVDPGCSEGGSWQCPSYDFQNCTIDWNAFNGSPNNHSTCTISNNTAWHIDPADGERFAGMGYGFGNGNVMVNEGIYTDVSLSENSLLTFKHRRFHIGNNNLWGSVDVEIGLSNNLGPIMNVPGPQPVINFTGPDLLTVITGLSSTEWVSESILIQVPTPLSAQLAFNPLPSAPNMEGWYALDDVQITPCSELPPPGYQFTDVDGNTTNEFCADEDVYVKFEEVDYYYGDIYFQIYGDVILTLGWTSITDNNCYNLSELMRDNNLGPLTSNMTHTLKTAVNHPLCGWIEEFNEFTITCCEGTQDDSIDAGFSCSFVDQLPSGIHFTGTATTDLSASGGTHEFCIYTDNDNDGFFDLVSCSSMPIITEILDPTTRYYFTHTVTTECGINCHTKDWCFDTNECSGVTEVDGCEDIITCDDLAPEYFFADANGNPKSEFCVGEEIYIKVSDVDYEYENIFFEVYANVVISAGWTTKADNNCYNLTALLIAKDKWPISPGSHSMKLALNVPECGWAERFENLNVLCCESNLNIDTDLNCEFLSTDVDDIFTYSTFAATDYTSTGATHEICIYTDLNVDGIFELVACVSDASMVIDLDRTTRYYVTHTVTTVCGVFCDVKEFCLSGCPTGVEVQGCDDIVLPECEVPIPSCPEEVNTFGNLQFNWTNTGAPWYEYEIVFNDPDCGCEGETTTWVRFAEESRIEIFIPSNECYSFRVRAYCDEELTSPWSSKLCSNDCEVSDDDKNGDDKNDEEGNEDNKESLTYKRSSLNSNNANKANISAYPSPFNSYLNVNVDGLQNEVVILRILDLMGKTHKTETIKVEDQSLNYKWDAISHMTSGIYLIQVVDGSHVYSKKVIKL